MLYQRVTGDFYTINSEGKFTLPCRKDLYCGYPGPCVKIIIENRDTGVTDAQIAGMKQETN